MKGVEARGLRLLVLELALVHRSPDRHFGRPEIEGLALPARLPAVLAFDKPPLLALSPSLLLLARVASPGPLVVAHLEDRAKLDAVGLGHRLRPVRDDRRREDRTREEEREAEPNATTTWHADRDRERTLTTVESRVRLRAAASDPLSWPSPFVPVDGADLDPRLTGSHRVCR